MNRRTRRSVAPPPKKISGFVVTLTLIAGVFAVVVAGILLTPTHHEPAEWWDLYVVPHLKQKAEAEAGGDWAGALEALDRAIKKAEERRADFRDRLGGLHAERKELAARLHREEKAGVAWRDLDRRAREAQEDPEPWKQKFERVREGRKVMSLCKGTAWEKRCKGTMKLLRDLPGPPPGWVEVRREAGVEMDRGQYGRALRLIAEFEPRADPGDVENVTRFRELIEERAWAEFRRRPEAGNLEADLLRYAGTKVEAELRKRG